MDRVAIKQWAKGRVLSNYGNCVVTVLLLELLFGAASAVGLGLGGLFLTPIFVGLACFSLRVYRGSQDGLECGFSASFSDYSRKLGGMLWMMLFTWLWSLLFLIPGIIKGLAYSMTPYILAECPNVPATDALKLSMRMTEGRKGEIFVMYLSFIGWMLLSSLTFGILYILYVGPYMQLSYAGMYDQLKQIAINEGRITPQELV